MNEFEFEDEGGLSAVPQTGLVAPGFTVHELLDEAPTSKFHRRAVLISGMGFFTDAYDLFVIGTVAAIVKVQWGLSTVQTSWVSGAAILGAFIGAFLFGRIADVLGRKTVYTTVAGIMIFGAIASAFAPSLIWLIIARFILGLGIGGDYPVSAVLMSEYANRHDRGRLVGMVFSMQAVGLIVGPLVTIGLLASGVHQFVAWRILLALGAVPAAAVIFLRARMPESPRFLAAKHGHDAVKASGLADFTEGTITNTTDEEKPRHRMSVKEFFTNPKMLLLLLGTAGSWFLFDYAYYGNTLSLPVILSNVSPTATLEGKLWMTLGIFVAFAVPGYVLAVWKMDRVGHRRLQVIGFTVMALSFFTLSAFAGLTTTVAPFLGIFGLSYFFTEFGPNTTTFVLPSEVFPVEMRTTGHGIAAGIGKLGAFVGVFLVPTLDTRYGLRTMLVVAGCAAVAGFGLSFLLPEPARQSLDEI